MTTIAVPPSNAGGAPKALAPLHVTQTLRVLCIGPIGSGKTVLIKSIEHWAKHEGAWTFGDIPEHSTTGQLSVNFNLNVDDARKRKRVIPVVIEEVGGSRSATWSNYYDECTVVMFVIDASNPFKVSSATCQLTDALGDSFLIGKHFLVAFTKNDVSHDSNGTLTELQNMMFYEDVVKTYTNLQRTIQTVSCSGLTCDGVNEVLRWLQNLVLGAQSS